jgi:hypothetical protein
MLKVAIIFTSPALAGLPIYSQSSSDPAPAKKTATTKPVNVTGTVKAYDAGKALEVDDSKGVRTSMT